MVDTDSTAPDGYLSAIAAGDADAAHQHVSALRRTGVAPAVIFDTVISPALRSIGEMWERGELSVAGEHIASDITDRVVSSMTQPDRASPVATRSALVACAEGEWHSLGARTLRACFIDAGWDARLLGASVTSSQLVTAIYDEGPDIVAVSCLMPANLPGARRMIIAAREAGTPVIVGGPAFGSTPERAALLGANGWAPGAVLAVDAAESTLGDATNATAPVPILDDRSLLDAQQHEIVAALSETMRGDLSIDGEMATGGIWLLRSVEAAVLCDDVSIIADQLRWQDRRARIGRAMPPAGIANSLRNALPNSATTAHQLLEEALASAGVVA